MAGGTAPVSLAGTLAIGNAELLSGLVIAQLKRKGTPFIYGGTFTVMDMSTTIFSLGAPELSLLCGALADMAHYYKLPVFGAAGLTDAKVLDQQAGIEASMSCLLSALTGSNLVHDIGHMESGLAASYEMIVMCDEIVSMVKRVMKGVEVNDESLAVDLIDRVGPGGYFVAEEHTLRHFRAEQWRPQFLDRSNYYRWNKDGKLTLGDKLNRKVKKILNEYSPEPLDPELIKEIRRIADVNRRL
jgi:trimethylamine--corrinoid protein Co-methyltransferase